MNIYVYYFKLVSIFNSIINSITILFMEKIKTIVKSTIDITKEKIVTEERINSLINFFTNEDNSDNSKEKYDDSFIGDLKRIEETWGWFVDPEHIVRNRNKNNRGKKYSEKELIEIENEYFYDIDSN